MSNKQQEILTHLEETVRRLDEVDEMMWDEFRSFKQLLGARQAELHYPTMECHLRLIRLMREISELKALPGPKPDITPEECPPLSQAELDRFREVLSRKSVTDAITSNAPECPELRNLPAVCNTIPYGNPTNQCHPILLVLPNDQNAIHCLGQALQHLGQFCPYTQHVVIAHHGTPSWKSAWILYEPSFRALSQRQGFNLYLL